MMNDGSNQNKDDNLVNSVKNALRILESFTLDETEKKLSHISRELNLSKSTVSRLLNTLVSSNYVTQDPDTKKYKLGLSVLSLSGIATSNFSYFKDAYPTLQKLTDSTRETTHLSILENYEVVYLHKVDSPHPIRMFTHVGSRNPAHSTSSGKVMLAYQSEYVIERLIERGLNRFTPTTITDPNEFRETLLKIKNDGFATCFEENMEGVVATAAPVKDYSGKVIAAITCTGPMQRMNHYNISKYIKKVKEAAKEVSKIIGYNSI